MADARTRTGFGPSVLAGLAAAILTAVASAKPWMSVDVPARLMPGIRDADRSADLPLALALSLVVLAGWGAILVARGRFRRVCAAIALAAALGVLGCAVAAPFMLPDDIRNGLDLAASTGPASVSGWYVTAVVADVVSVAILVVAWRRVPTWPTMSSRYDAPATRAAEPDETDLWKALDAGHDPTDPST